jgi:spore coat polysaccharide biosynthesis protein SpsF
MHDYPTKNKKYMALFTPPETKRYQCKNMTIGIIIQARMGSQRLPGKIIKKIGHHSILEHIIRRLKRLTHKARTIIATSLESQDNIVERFCRANNIHCFRGDHENVLKRYYDCALKNKFENIVRLTGDNPFFDIEEIDRLIDLHLNSNSDLSHSYSVLPMGVGAEVFTFNALEKSILNTKDPYHLEHVDEYILQNPQLFKISILDVQESKNRPDLMLTVDTQKDYQKACFIVEQSKNTYITTQIAINLAIEYETITGI